jgi:hypothetical protein
MTFELAAGVHCETSNQLLCRSIGSNNLEFLSMTLKRKQVVSTSPRSEVDKDGEPSGGVDPSDKTQKQNLARVASDAIASTKPATSEQAFVWCHQARSLWLNEATNNKDLETVELLYRAALNAKKDLSVENKKKKRKTTNGSSGATSYAVLSPADYRKAGERLSLLYLQSGRPQKAKPGLKYLGFTCRLSERILNYPNNLNLSSKPQKKKNFKSKKTPPACILDDFLSASQSKFLRDIFCDINADYWTGHDYAVEPPSPYFSYVIPIPKTQKVPRLSFLETLIQQMLNCPHLRQQFPLLSKARYVELWAHNRPHASGHQMHFDSDNEGIGGVRNPIISTILYLSDNHNVGGPSLITNQTLQSTSLSNVLGWLAYSRPHRLVAFDGKVLHGVIPGKGVVSDRDFDSSTSSLQHQQSLRRVTLMLAFWKNIQIRDSSTPCAARPWPKKGDEMPSWARQLNALIKNGNQDVGAPKLAEPVPIGHVYEDLDGNSLIRDEGMPEYEEVFQGF